MKSLSSLSKLFTVSLVGVFVTVGCTGFNTPEAPTLSQAQGPAPQPTIPAKSAFQKSYNLKGWGACETGPQEVVGNNEEELKKNLCERLLTGGANNHCAESERLDFFLQECPGQEWRPTESGGMPTDKYDAEGTFSGLYPNHPMLKALKVTGVALNKNVTEEQKQQADKITTVFKNCSLELKCLSSLQPWMFSISQLTWQPGNQKVWVINMARGLGILSPSKTAFYVLIKFEASVSSHKVVPTVELWQGNYNIGFRTYQEFFNHKTSAQLLATMSASYPQEALKD